MSKGLPDKNLNFSAWYNELVKKADLAENSSIALSGSFSGNPIPFDKSAAIEVISSLIKGENN